MFQIKAAPGKYLRLLYTYIHPKIMQNNSILLGFCQIFSRTFWGRVGECCLLCYPEKAYTLLS